MHLRIIFDYLLFGIRVNENKVCSQGPCTVSGIVPNPLQQYGNTSKYSGMPMDRRLTWAVYTESNESNAY